MAFRRPPTDYTQNSFSYTVHNDHQYGSPIVVMAPYSSHAILHDHLRLTWVLSIQSKPRDWNLETFPTRNTPIQDRTQDHSSCNRARIIHVHRVHRQECRERHPDEHEDNVTQSRDIDDGPCPAKSERPPRDWRRVRCRQTSPA